MMNIFQSTLNTRTILENNTKYIRSDVPTAISEEEKAWLLSNGITAVVDLRTEEERAVKKCPLIEDNDFSYHCFSLTGGDKVPQSVGDVSESYIGMVDEKFKNLIDFLLNAKSGVLYFCNAGKDRTGVVSAVLLHKLGFPEEYIVADYMKSKDNLAEMLNDYAKNNPAINIDVITPRREYIEKFLEWYKIAPCS